MDERVKRQRRLHRDIAGKLKLKASTRTTDMKKK